jgi:hypothetical protein
LNDKQDVRSTIFREKKGLYIIFDNVSSNKYFKKNPRIASYTQHARFKKEEKRNTEQEEKEDRKKIQSTEKQQLRVNEKLEGKKRKREKRKLCSRL